MLLAYAYRKKKVSGRTATALLVLVIALEIYRGYVYGGPGGKALLAVLVINVLVVAAALQLAERYSKQASLRR